MATRAAAGEMPPGCSTHGKGCPTPLDIAVLQSWVAGGAAYDVAGDQGPTTCP